MFEKVELVHGSFLRTISDLFGVVTVDLLCCSVCSIVKLCDASLCERFGVDQWVVERCNVDGSYIIVFVSLSRERICPLIHQNPPSTAPSKDLSSLHCSIIANFIFMRLAESREIAKAPRRLKTQSGPKTKPCEGGKMENAKWTGHMLDKGVCFRC